MPVAYLQLFEGPFHWGGGLDGSHFVACFFEALNSSRGVRGLEAEHDQTVARPRCGGEEDACYVHLAVPDHIGYVGKHPGLVRHLYFNPAPDPVCPDELCEG